MGRFFAVASEDDCAADLFYGTDYHSHLGTMRGGMAIHGEDDKHLDDYADPASGRHATMVERIRQQLGLTSLQYQKLDDLVAAIGLPKSRLCTYCWDGAESCCEQLWLLPVSRGAAADSPTSDAS